MKKGKREGKKWITRGRRRKEEGRRRRKEEGDKE